MRGSFGLLSLAILARLPRRALQGDQFDRCLLVAIGCGSRQCIDAVALCCLRLPGMWLALAVCQVIRAVAERRLELAVGPPFEVLHVLDVVAGIALDIQSCFAAASILANVLVPGELAARDRKADRKIVAIAKPHAHSPIGAV